MNTSLHQSYSQNVSGTGTKKSFWNRFISWCAEQEKNRLGWLAASLTIHGCVLTIITMFIVILSGNHFIFWPFIIAAMGITLVVNLAAMPTRITIPVFFASVLADLLIIASSILIG